MLARRTSFQVAIMHRAFPKQSISVRKPRPASNDWSRRGNRGLPFQNPDFAAAPPVVYLRSVPAALRDGLAEPDCGRDGLVLVQGQLCSSSSLEASSSIAQAGVAARRERSFCTARTRFCLTVSRCNLSLCAISRFDFGRLSPKP